MLRQRKIKSGLGLAALTLAAALWPLLPAQAAVDAAVVSASVQVGAHGAEVSAGSLRMDIQAVADDILRVRIAPDGAYPEDSSWVVPKELRAGVAAVTAWHESDADGFRTSALDVRIEHSPLRLVVRDLAGHVLSADTPTGAVQVDGHAFTLRKSLAYEEKVFGLGDKTGPLDRHGGNFVDWNTDAYGFQESTDPIYKSIPFFIVTGGAAGSYGIFLDNTWRAWFDFGKREAETLAFGAPDGPINYYLVYGPSLKRVVQRYTDLAGKAPLPPLWSLGFQQSRYSYMDAVELRGIASRLRSEHIPADVLWLDIDYQDRNRPFTVNTRAFPDLGGLAGELRGQGMRLVTITDLHIANAPNQGYAPYDSGMAGDHFVKRADGSVYVGPVWPGPAVFPDFTSAGARRWWGEQYADLVKAGVSGFWNDMNEPAVFETPTKTMPPDVVHRIDEPGFAPRLAPHAEAHNIMGLENARATVEGLLRLRPDERPYVMTRASFAGGQRYGVTWTGDNSATFNHLKLSISMLLNLGMSGFSYSGADVGGFAGMPSPEIMTRWIEVATFTPVFRAHSEKLPWRKEPWSDGPAQLAIRRHYIEERYRLLPYVYALADENARTGAPLMRPVFYDYPDALQFPCGQSTSFTFGRSLWIAPPANFESPADYDICLPTGRWFDYWTGAELQAAPPAGAAGQKPYFMLRTKPALVTLPVYVRGGTILPRQPLVQSTAETPAGPLQLDVYPGEDCRGDLYLDDGHSFGFQRGEYLRQQVHCAVQGQKLLIHFADREGHYQPWWHTLSVHVHGWSGAATAKLGDHAVATRRTGAGPTSVLVIDIPDQAASQILNIEPAGKTPAH